MEFDLSVHHCLFIYFRNGVVGLGRCGVAGWGYGVGGRGGAG